MKSELQHEVVPQASIHAGVRRTMITPFLAGGSVDYASLDVLVDWYLARGVHGLFAVCKSSEMFHLSVEEGVAVASRVAGLWDACCGVIA